MQHSSVVRVNMLIPLEAHSAVFRCVSFCSAVSLFSCSNCFLDCLFVTFTFHLVCFLSFRYRFALYFLTPSVVLQPAILASLLARFLPTVNDIFIRTENNNSNKNSKNNNNAWLPHELNTLAMTFKTLNSNGRQFNLLTFVC